MLQIECKNLILGYERHKIITNLNFTVSKGDYLCIVGENGSGKTTIMKTLLSLQPPISGEVVFGEGIKASEIGYLPQQTAVQMDFPASVQEIVLSGCQNRIKGRPFYNKTEKKIAFESMKKMDVLKFAEKCYRELSGGQQQRVLLARALCATQKIILLDEPVSGLDPVATGEMYRAIKELNDNGITIIMVSHDILAAEKYASHVLYVGNPVFYGTKEDYCKSEIRSHFSSKY